jgi:TonB-dependent SusC/RagA subfamily outer membrane receptor
LLIVDGVRKDDTDGALRNMNPEGIEKVEVLKDVSAEALYGEQGKYGVLLITTKKGFKAEPVAPVVRDTVQFRSTIRLSNVEGRNTGLGSFSGLFILDGVQCDSLVFRNIKPEDIESINVLKGESGRALYGSKGAQGVIIITTKKKDQRITGTFDPASDGPRHFVATAEGSRSLPEEALRDHILYVGVENRLLIDFKDIKPGELKVSMSGDAPGFGLSVDYKKGIATIKPANPGKAELVISRRKPDGSEVILQKQVYDIKLLPSPITFVSDRSLGRPPVQADGKPSGGRIDNQPPY